MYKERDLESEFYLSFNIKEKTYTEIKKEFERTVLEALIKKHKFNMSKAAIEMGISRTTCRNKYAYYFGNKYFPQLKD